MGYKTFEDMKHNIPEGATHYQNETQEFSFAWFNVDEDKCYVDGEWWPYSLDGYPMDEIKPIPPTIKTESPEEREALDMIDTTSKQVESLAKGDVVEWKAGDECVYKLHGALVVGWHPFHPVLVIDSDAFGLVSCTIDELSKPESQEQKAERERLEAAYDLYITAMDSGEIMLYETFKGTHISELYLRIVDKTGYRKQ